MIKSIESSVYRFRYVMLVVLTFCLSVQYLSRIKTGILMPFISHDIGLTNVQIGISGSLMLLFYGPSNLVTGWICDKFGSRRVLIFSIISWSFLTFCQGLASTVMQWYVLMVVFGALVGTEFVPSSRLIVRYFPPLHRGRATGIFSCGYLLTPAWTPILATLLYTWFGNNWHDVFKVLGCFGVVPLVTILLFVHDKPEDCRFVKKEEAVESYADEIEKGLITKEDVLRGDVSKIATMKKNADVTMLDILKTPGYVPMVIVYIAGQLAYWGVAVWSAQYLSKVHGFSVMKMGAWAAVYFAGGVVGSFLSGWLSDVVFGGRRKPMIITSFVMMIPFVILLASLKAGASPWLLLLSLTGMGFFSNMIWAPALSMPADMFTVEVYGKALGFMNCFGYMSAAASPYMMGLLITVDPVTKVQNYFYAWMWIACTALAGALVGLALIDKRREAKPLELQTATAS